MLRKRTEREGLRGGIIMGIRRELIEKGTRIEGKGESMIGDGKQGRERWRIVRRYVGQGVEKILNGLQQWMEEKEEGVRTLVGRTLMRGLEGKEGD